MTPTPPWAAKARFWDRCHSPLAVFGKRRRSTKTHSSSGTPPTDRATRRKCPRGAEAPVAENSSTCATNGKPAAREPIGFQCLALVGMAQNGSALAFAALALLGAGCGAGDLAGDPARKVTIDYPSGGEIPAQRTTDFAAAMKAAGCDDEATEQVGAGQHTSFPDERVDYASEPPSIGPHYQEWPEDDIYEEAPPTTHVVHTLEHGRILIWLSPELPDEQLAQFKALYDEDSYHVIMLPREELKEPFAVTAWVGDSTGHTLRCREVNDSTWDAIRAFKEKYRDKAPEFEP